MSTSNRFNAVIRTHHSHGQGPGPSNSSGIGKGIGNHPFNRRHRKLAKDNILAISKASIRKLARRGGIRRIQGEIYDEARAAIKARLTAILRHIVLVLESDGPKYEVENMQRQTLQQARKTVMAKDVVYALNAMGITLYGFGWYDSGVEPTKRTTTARRKLLPETPTTTSSDDDSQDDDSSTSDESSIVG